MSLKLVRFKPAHGHSRFGLLQQAEILDLSAAGIDRLSGLLDGPAPVAVLEALSRQPLPRVPLASVKLLAPVDQQEVWAAGVTYLRSKKARMEESDFSASAYDRVYEAPRPELFFKSLPQKVSEPGGKVGIRRDATWNVPEPELALVFNSRGEIVGYTSGNDMSSRDIEGENLLYLPQAKTYRHSCALGPCVVLGVSEAEVREWKIQITITRGGQGVFEGNTAVGQIKRSFAELGDYLFRSQEFPQGAILLTGTGVVPPDSFTLAAGDIVRITIGEIGLLENEVVVV
ncbi:MAG: fumarylacetoacetate hydrolase family protein [Verrucomicrobiales bacterium]|jgi:2-dehydro-3-deoxy-D-arabinonate dehydratase|nr:fumarylacetoacetate hydrolase family protein [Verrucomicrobiales bacterium]